MNWFDSFDDYNDTTDSVDLDDLKAEEAPCWDDPWER